MTSHNKNGRFCVGFPHTLSALVIFIYLFIYLFVLESQLFVTWSLLGRERTLGMRMTLGMSVCVWRPLLFSTVVIRLVPSRYLRVSKRKRSG